MKTFAHPRWEDFEYEYIDDNPQGWLGDGMTEDERNRTVNVDYLDDDQVDFPTPVNDDVTSAALNGKGTETKRSEAVGSKCKWKWTDQCSLS